MALIVEDGTGLAGANSYVSMDDCALYCADRGLSFATSPSATGEAALIRATEAIDAIYRGRFPGYRVRGRAQALEWPRLAAYDVEGNLIVGDEIPIEVVNATCEAAVRELAVPNSMMPDLKRGGHLKSFKAGSVAVEFGANAAPGTVFSLIDGILAGILGGGSGGGLFGVAVRG